MQVLKFNIRNQRISRYNSALVAADSYGYLRCEFNFITKDWKDTEIKMANFYHKGRNYPVLIDENNQCEVPEEVIKLPSFRINIFGGGITTNTITIPVEDSGMFEKDTETDTKYYNQIINKLTAEIDELKDTKADGIIHDEETNTIQLVANGTPIGDAVDYSSCGIKSFDVDENDNITITLMNGRVIDLGNIEGASGVTFIPHVSEDKILSWTNDGGLDNPKPVDLNPFDEWIELEDGGEAPSQYTWEFI